MKIVQIITRSDVIGGAHIHVLDISKRLVEMGNEVIIYTGGQGPFTVEITNRNLAYRSLCYLVRPVSFHNDWRAIWELRRFLKTDRPDLVATHSSKAGLLGRISASTLSVPSVFTAHGWAFTEGVPQGKRFLYTLAERFAAPFCKRIITVSEYDRTLALRHRVGSEKKIVTVHNGVANINSDYFANPHGEPTRLIMVARFEEQKDHETLLYALNQLSDIPWELDLVGDGPLLANIKRLAVELGLDERIHFFGTRKDVEALLSRAQVFLLISKWEGLPLSILEAMRARLPVIASKVGGVQETIVEGVTGYLVPPKDFRILQDRIKTLLRSSDLRKKMGEAGQKLFQQNFTLDAMTSKTIHVYKDALGLPEQLRDLEQ